MAASERALSFCPPLCFILSKFGKLTNNKIKEIVKDFYNFSLIWSAKRLLFEDIDKIQVDFQLPRFHERRESVNQPKVNKDIDDIITAVNVLDERGLLYQLPRYVTDNSDNIPALRVEDGDMRYFATKLEKMEVHMNNLYAMVDKMANQLIHMQGNTTSFINPLQTVIGAPSAGLRTSTAAAGLTIGPTAGPTGPTQSTALSSQQQDTQKLTNAWLACARTAEKNETETRASTSSSYDWAAAAEYMSPSEFRFEDGDTSDGGAFQQVTRRRHRIKRSRQYRSGQQVAAQNGTNTDGGDSTTAAGDAAGNAGGGGATQPAARSFAEAVVAGATQTQDRQHATKRRPLLVGNNRTVNPNNPAMVAAKPYYGKAVFCINNVDNQMSVESMCEFLAELSVRVCTCHEITLKLTAKQKRLNLGPDHKMFRVCINKADCRRLLIANKWPADIAISAWRFNPNRKKDANSDAAQDAPTSAPADAAEIVTEAVTSPAAADTVADDDEQRMQAEDDSNKTVLVDQYGNTN